MDDSDTRSPEVLVLGGGGILGEAWMSAVLAGLDEAEGFDSRGCRRYVGTSAGSIVAASLVAGIAPDARLGRLPEQPAVSGRDGDAGALLRLAFGAAVGVGGAAVAPFASLALNSSSAGGALLRRAALRRVPHGRRSLDILAREVERSGIHWDGRLRVAAVELESGRRTMFGSLGTPQVSVALAVQASCSIPGVFRPVRVDGRTYVDGGVWSPTNMDGAGVEHGDRVLCLNPTASMRPTLGAPAGALGPVSRAIAAAEALALKYRGATVTTINPDIPSSAALGSNLMDAGRRADVIEAGFAQGRRHAFQLELDAA